MYSIVGSSSTAVRILSMMCSSESENVSMRILPISYHPYDSVSVKTRWLNIYSSRIAERILVFFNSDFAYIEKTKYITISTAISNNRNIHGSFKVIQ